MVSGVVPAGGWAWSADDQHDPLLQFQGDPLDSKTAVAGYRPALPGLGRGLAVLGVCPGDIGGHLCGRRRRAASGAVRAPSSDFADRVIHAFVRRDSNRIVIAGASSLLGAELKSLLEESRFAGWELRLVDEQVAVGTLTEAGGEPAVIQPVEEGSFEKARFVFFTGSPQFTRANLL